MNRAREVDNLQGRVWPLIVVGGGPGSAAQLARSDLQPSDVLVISDRFGGGMEFLGPIRLQSYAEELALVPGRVRHAMRLRPIDLQPDGWTYSRYVRECLDLLGPHALTGDVFDVYSSGDMLRLEVDTAQGKIGLAASQVVLATGTQPRDPPDEWVAFGARSYDAVVADLLNERLEAYLGTSVLIVGSGNSALQAASLVGPYASDVTILAKSYRGLYPQETDDRFAWRAQSQITCELVSKGQQLCGYDARFAPCIRFLCYDDLALDEIGRPTFSYTSANNDNPLGRASLPPRCAHTAGRYETRGDGRWTERRPAGTVLIWATGVRPLYPPGPHISNLPMSVDGVVEHDARGQTDMASLYVGGACAGFRSVNEMLPAVAGSTQRRAPVTYRLARRMPNGAEAWRGGFRALGPTERAGR